MPFCTNCGTEVEPKASFCYRCGQRQPRVDSRAEFHTTDFLDGISDRTASILCYIPVFGIIPSIVFLAAQKFRRNSRVRFDAFQSLYLFVAWLIVATAFPNSNFGDDHRFAVQFALFGLMKFAVFACWVYLLVKAAQQEQVRLPLIGDLAARSAAEQM